MECPVDKNRQKGISTLVWKWINLKRSLWANFIQNSNPKIWNKLNQLVYLPMVIGKSLKLSIYNKNQRILMPLKKRLHPISNLPMDPQKLHRFNSESHWPKQLLRSIKTHWSPNSLEIGLFQKKNALHGLTWKVPLWNSLLIPRLHSWLSSKRLPLVPTPFIIRQIWSSWLTFPINRERVDELSQSLGMS